MPLHLLARAALAAALVVWSLLATAVEPPVYSIAIVPQSSATQMYAGWQPLLKRVGDDAGIRLDIKLHGTIPTFETAFLRGEPDFIFGNPYHAVMARRAQGYVPLVRDTETLVGVLVVPTNSPARTLKDLDGQKVAFPAPNAFGASLYMRALIDAAAVRIEPNYVKTHGNVYRRVALGEFAAGGGINQTFNDQTPEIRAQLRILYQTSGAAPHPVMVHPRVPQLLRERIVGAFLNLAKDNVGRALLKEVLIPKPVAADYMRDYAPLEQLHLDNYLVLEK